MAFTNNIMIVRHRLLTELVKLWMDTVDLALCLFIYEVCNDYQFEYPSSISLTIRP